MTYDPAIAVIENVRTARVILRAPTGRDVDTLFRIYGDPRTNAFNPVGPLRSLVDAETTMARWLDHWIEHDFGMWAIALAWIASSRTSGRVASRDDVTPG
ncbi:GNAT family N-acetyltransferase [Paraburkholderia terricola]|uniref:GNAT family N-acetyltransferase n=1 Tax=Paraburkholderia terricola TaxID=169427 RepID=UPI003F4F8574